MLHKEVIAKKDSIVSLLHRLIPQQMESQETDVHMVTIAQQVQVIQHHVHLENSCNNKEQLLNQNVYHVHLVNFVMKEDSNNQKELVLKDTIVRPVLQIRLQRHSIKNVMQDTTAQLELMNKSNVHNTHINH
jgi:hypothetical protein